MHYLVYPTEECNLRCAYCDTEEERKHFVKKRQYKNDELLEFFKGDPEPGITFYGGEPTLDVEFIQNILNEIDFSYVSIVTNAYRLKSVPLECLNKMNMISISVDGDKETTDKKRGRGAYETAVKGATWLKENKFNGLVAARMTCCQDNDIEKDVKHLASLNLFDLIHWQLNVFHEQTFENFQNFGKWLIYDYNKKISKLIEYWLKEMKGGNLIKIVPFIGIMDTLLTKKPVKNVRCGAGHKFWVISTEGKIFACPLFRDEGNEISSIWQNSKNLTPKFNLKDPCLRCSYFNVCGGRCLYLNSRANDKQIYPVVCHSIKHLIRELNRIKPQVQELLKEQVINMEEFKDYYEHEVIP